MSTSLQSNKLALLIFVAIGLIVTGLHVRYSASGLAHDPIDYREAARDWWLTGECEECHNPAAVGDEQPAVPQFHSQQFRLYTHGRDDRLNPDECSTCHTTEGCKSCHAKPPANHTSGYLKPLGGDHDSRLHATLGRIRPSSCMTCHRSLVQSCGECHTPVETSEWTEKAAPELERWPDLKPGIGNGDGK